MAIKDRMSGNEAVAYAMKQINPDVMGAFPITPSTEIPVFFEAISLTERWRQSLSRWNRALCHVHLYRRIGRGSSRHHSDFLSRTGSDVGALLYVQHQQTACHHGGSQQSFDWTDQHQQRPF